MEKSAGIIIFNRGKEITYLLLKYQAGHWDFPKGHIESNESEIDAALRETKEETGISGVSLIEGFKEKLSYFFTQDGRKVYKEVVYFLAESKSTEVKLSFEHIGFEWLPFKEAMARITFNSSRKILESADMFLKKSINFGNFSK